MSLSENLSRRTVLRGVGAAMALPFLDVMSPLARAAETAAVAPAVSSSGAPVRLACLFQPNGVFPAAWDPKGVGTDYELSPILAPLAKVRQHVTVLSNLDNCKGKGHVVATGGFLTGVAMKNRVNAVSLDQLVAQKVGGQTQLPSIELGTEYMQRTALQGSPTTLMAVTGEYYPGARVYTDDIHPFKKYFEDLQIGETLITHRRTVTEADIVNFGCVSGDHFYAHFDEIAAKDSFFGKRVAHGYFVISAAAGMFVDPAPGPVIANYGLENLRFIEPVAAGDTIRAKLSVKRKIKKAPRGDEQPNGVVVWAIEVTNQEEKPVAVYDIMTLVARREA